jgi:hypothetical protein
MMRVVVEECDNVTRSQATLACYRPWMATCLAALCGGQGVPSCLEAQSSQEGPLPLAWSKLV